MIEIMTGVPDGAPGFDATGKVTGEAYETVLVPAVENMLSRLDIASGCAQHFRVVFRSGRSNCQRTQVSSKRPKTRPDPGFMTLVL
jgi:hypothetical protein